MKIENWKKKKSCSKIIIFGRDNHKIKLWEILYGPFNIVKHPQDKLVLVMAVVLAMQLDILQRNRKV